MQQSSAQRGASSVLGWVVLSIIGLVLLGRCAGPPPNYSYSISDHGMFGCQDRDVLDRIVILSGQQGEAWRTLAIQHCVPFQKGQELVVERYDGFRERYLARRPHDPQAYWFLRSFVDKREVKG